MAVPPFPSQDLAKLVLGYLAEEQLMTAYDEFLQASPYLDALKNEYDRIFMTSLKNILAEYRAVKIYVETCKPYALRRRLFGCTNLLEVVKFLIQHVDYSKIQGEDPSKVSSDTRSSIEKSFCAVCNSLKLTSCVCKSRHNSYTTDTPNLLETQTLEHCVETTLLEDLPGQYVTTRRKQVRILPKECKTVETVSNTELNVNTNSDNVSIGPLDATSSSNSQNSQIRLNYSCCGTSNNLSSRITPVQPKIQKLDKTDVLKPTRNNKTIQRFANNMGGTLVSSNISAAGTFQDFTKGVERIEKVNTIVPDSSTSETNLQSQSVLSNEITIPGCTQENKPVSKAHIFLTVGTIKNNPSMASNQDMSNPGLSHTAIKAKTSEQKVTILSDIKVDKTFSNDNSNMPAVLQNATSTPMMQMQTILINGTPVYKQQPQMGPTRNFTKDEIMAMPTIIVVPTSGPSKIPPRAQHEPIPPESKNYPPDTVNTVESCKITEPLGPLVIDVASNSSNLEHKDTEPNSMPILIQSKENGTGLVKKLEAKNISLPKGNFEGPEGTPQVLPPLRKSSSTPRRSSHVRVLDFTTPRRILEDAITEQCESSINNSVEVIVSRSPNLHTFSSDHANYADGVDGNEVCKEDSDSYKNNESSKDNENCIKVPSKKPNWDADLRALAITNKKEDIPKSCIKPRCRPRSKTDKKNKLPVTEKKESTKTSSTVKHTPKTPKTSKKKAISVEVIEEPVDVSESATNVLVKPTINIITGPDWHLQENEKVDKSQNKSNEDPIGDTPEMDRLSLQNAIGAKLNISDLLETPYKQALYDIQMETPRFLGPDLPGEPLSDIKIMNIPTPRFLNTPKPQATPSSYSSRPTDYSSGGSYYKPDDQDYLPVDIEYPPLSKETEIVINTNIDVAEAKERSSKANYGSLKSRPVRKCAKNVSYYNSSQLNKTKYVEDKLEVASSCSETVSVHSVEHKVEKDKIQTPKIAKKRKSTSKKHKTPVKKETPKTFMKIKPRRVTPSKECLSGKSKRKSSEGQGRKRISGKEKSVNDKPVVVALPTKSRRKSSTPRKLHCTKTFNSESSGQDSPEIKNNIQPNDVKDSTLITYVQDSDTEQLPLRWSDDGSQDTKPQESNVMQSKSPIMNESEDISKIKEYIASELLNASKPGSSNELGTGNLHVDLVKRGFDIETARSIERDLLDTPPYTKEASANTPVEIIESKKEVTQLEKTFESDASSCLKIVQEDEDCDEIELSISECTEESKNYFVCQHDDTKESSETPLATLKDKFSMEVCIDDGVAIRLRATPFSVSFDQDPEEVPAVEYSFKETELAVNSISNIDKLYTPMKDSLRAQVYDIFDSTLTSLDTPLKLNSPKRKECDTTVTEIVLEVEKLDERDKDETKKRKRLHSGGSDESTSQHKKAKPETQYLLSSANIQNIDIETVLSKLHGP